MRRTIRSAVIFTVALFACYGCGTGGPSPRERVLDFVRLIQSDSLPNILPFIDADSVSSYEYSAAQFQNLTLQQKRERLINGFMGDGEYRRTWAKSQIVVNEEKKIDDSTYAVEVSFIDRSTRIQYYNQMALRHRDGNWVIYKFKLL